MARLLILPVGPSVNLYWRSAKGRVYVSKEGKDFRKTVCASEGRPGKPMLGRLKVLVEFYPPDRRRRDLDNLMKATLDAVQAAGWYEDDSQIDDLHIKRREVTPGGMVVMTIGRMR